MAAFTDIEKEFRINVSSPDFDIVRGIEVAIEIELRGRKFYSEAARKVSGPLQPFFRFLAEQEREHETDLNELKGSLKAAKAWIKLPATQVQEPLKDFSAFRKHPGNEHTDSTGDVQAILAAMKMEKQTREFYIKLADSAKKPEGRSFFTSLADWEKGHYELLSGLYNAETYTRLET